MFGIDLLKIVAVIGLGKRRKLAAGNGFWAELAQDGNIESVVRGGGDCHVEGIIRLHRLLSRLDQVRHPAVGFADRRFLLGGAAIGGDRRRFTLGGHAKLQQFQGFRNALDFHWC